jgi:hypothetical protein
VKLDVGLEPDVVLVASVFTHMYPDAIAHYLDEIGTLIGRSTRIMATFFLINDSQRQAEADGRSRYPLEHEFNNFARYWNRDDPLHVMAYQKDWVVSQAAEAGLEIRATHLGSWCGRTDARPYQDTLIMGLAPNRAG